MTGGKRWTEEEEVTHMSREPEVCPPRPSEMATLSWQLLQAPAGEAVGVNWAVLEVESCQVPAQEAVQRYWSASPSESVATTDTVVGRPTCTEAGEREMEEATGQ